LSNDLAIKGIAMMVRQPEQLKNMLGSVGQDSEVQILDRLAD
jgi:hypothetical protein